VKHASTGTGIDENYNGKKSPDHYMPAIIKPTIKSRDLSSEMVTKSIDLASQRSDSMNKFRKNISLEILKKR
jgi:hypothetical protein